MHLLKWIFPWVIKIKRYDHVSTMEMMEMYSHQPQAAIPSIVLLIQLQVVVMPLEEAVSLQRPWSSPGCFCGSWWHRRKRNAACLLYMDTHGNRLFVEAPSSHPHCPAEVVISDTPASTGDVAVPESTDLRYKQHQWEQLWGNKRKRDQPNHGKYLRLIGLTHTAEAGPS